MDFMCNLQVSAERKDSTEGTGFQAVLTDSV